VKPPGKEKREGPGPLDEPKGKNAAILLVLCAQKKRRGLTRTDRQETNEPVNHGLALYPKGEGGGKKAQIRGAEKEVIPSLYTLSLGGGEKCHIR